MPVSVHLDPDLDELPDLTRLPSKIDLYLIRHATGADLPAVVIVPEGAVKLGTVITLRELIASVRSLAAKVEDWPEWQQADTPAPPE